MTELIEKSMTAIAALALLVLAWHLASSSFQARAPRSGPWVVFVGWILLVLLSASLFAAFV